MKILRVVCIVCMLSIWLTASWTTAAGADGLSADNGTIVNAQWTSYTNGNWINGLAFDLEGCLWAASSGGAVCWDLDEKDYVKYTSEHGLCSNQLSAVTTAPDGTVWFASLDNGVSGFKDGVFTTYTVQDGLPSNEVADIAAAPDGVVWAATDRGVASFDGQSWQTYAEGPGKDVVEKVVCDPDGNVWFGTGYQGLFRLSGTEWTQYRRSADLSNGAEDRSLDFEVMALAADGSVWASFYKIGLVRFSGDDVEIISPDRYDLGDAIHITEDGALWVASGQDVIRLQNGEEEEFWGDYSLPTGFDTTCIISGPDGTIWCGGFSGGLAGYRDGQWTVLKTQDWLPENSVYGIAVTGEGNLWIIAQASVTYFDGENAAVYITWLKPQDFVIASDGAVWMSLSCGIFRFDGQQWTYFGPGDSPGRFGYDAEAVIAPIQLKSGVESKDWYLEILLDQNDRLLCLNSSGEVHSLSDGKWSALKTPADRVSDIYLSPQGVYWISSLDGLFSSTDGENWKQYPQILDSNAIIYNSGTLYVAPDETCWVGSSSGLGCRPADGDSFFIRRGNGIPDDEVCCIADTPDGVLWIGTVKQGSLTAGSGAAVYDDGVWDIFTASDGLGSSAVRGITVTEDCVWFSTTGGLSEYRTDPAR